MGFFKKSKEKNKSKKETETKPVVDNKPKEKSKEKVEVVKPKDSMERELIDLNKFNGKLDKETLSKINSKADLTDSDKKKVGNVYPYWVIILDKFGDRISSFGVNRDTWAGVDLLVRIEDKGAEKHVVFRNLLPDADFNLDEVKKNKKKYLDELNKLKQLEDKLEKNLISSKPLKYNYDLADIKLKILDREIKLKSIRHGVRSRYTHKGIRDDGIPVIMYTYRNGNLELIKYVEESNLFTEASEQKKIQDHDAEKQIDRTFKKRDDRDWKKIALFSIWVFMTGIYVYGGFQWLNYNEDRAFSDAKKKFEDLVDQQNAGVEKIVNTIEKSQIDDSEFQKEFLKQHKDLVESIVSEGSVPKANE